MDNISELAKTIEPYIKAYGTYSSTMLIGKKLISSAFNFVKNVVRRTHFDIDEIFDEIEREDISVGDVIETSGIILKYGQVFKPYTHVNAMFSNCTIGEEKEVYRNGKKMIRNTIAMTSKAFQPPIQKIPPYNDIGCAFIYDYRFTGFNHQLNKEREEQKDKPLIIDKYSKPILVLYDTAKQERYLNKEVLIKGRIINLPKSLVQNLNGIFDNSIRDICSNFFRPFNENINFICISLLDSECSINEVSKIDMSSIKAPLYVETQAEGLSKLEKLEAQKLIQTILPNLPQKLDPHFPLTVGTFNDNIGTPFLSINNINVVYRQPETIGFYTDTFLYDEDSYAQTLEQLSTFICNFAIDYRNIAKKIIGTKLNIDLNFLFDYEKQYLFDRRGVLSSKLARDFYEEDESLRYVQDWLKGKATI